ncbi:SUMF1/EgtB/PvdO family nonheme iron enzyme [Anabaena sp. CCY 9614]|uniref:SUMF1/EgtB/PvdO family nonheme iron enzyme n=1 Tax=Anabaena sp. CCY 9614 TaxID=3103869 RepID=UPI0039C685D0
MSDQTPPKVFISYSWDSPEHQKRVLALSDKLREWGIDCNLDRYETSPAEGWPRWMAKQIEQANFVLVICTLTYKRRCEGEEEPGRGNGVRWEGHLTYQDLYNAGTLNRKFIPVLLESGKFEDIPKPLQGTTYYFAHTDEGYENLYRHLTNQPGYQKPRLGKLRPLPHHNSTSNPQPVPPIKPPQPPIDSQSELEKFEFAKLTIGRGDKIQRQNYTGKAEKFVEDLGTGVKLEMVKIPGEIFLMGASQNEEGSGDDERPQHQVKIPSFFMGKYLITQAQWARVAAFFPRVKQELDPRPSSFKGDDNLPVESISWYDAVEFCQRLSQKTRRNYRLPSEAEWEYACRAGTVTHFHFGDIITTEVANYDGNYTYSNSPKGEYRQKTTPVGSFPPNAFGLYDMNGNLWEWCQDTWHSSYEGAPDDGSAWVDNDNQFRLLRGGSCVSNPDGCRFADRNNSNPDNADDNIGFRVVCSSVAARTL